MYINPFWAGVLSTLFIELSMFLLFAIFAVVRNRRMGGGE